MKCEAVLGTASIKCPFCGEITRLGSFRYRLLRARWYSLLVAILGFVVLVIARGQPGHFLGLAAVLGGCAVYVSARFVDEKIRG